MRLIILLMALFVGSIGVAQADNDEALRTKAQQMINDADAARKKAASVDGEWRDTGKIIKKAQKALDSGKITDAMKLASAAHKQGVLGYQQAMDQQTISLPSYLNY